MAKGKRADKLSELMQAMIDERGERISRGRDWEEARTTLGQARWFATERDISPEINQVRACLARGGLSLRDIGTSEKEIAKLLELSRDRTTNALQTAKGYLAALRKAIERGDDRAVRILLSQLERKIDGAQLKPSQVGTSSQELREWRRQFPALSKKTKC